MRADKVKVIVEASSGYKSEREMAKHFKRILGWGYKISGYNAVMCRLGVKRKKRKPVLRVIKGDRKAA